jgi:hypothetical protein
MARRRKVRFSGRFYLTMLVLLGIVVALVLIIPAAGRYAQKRHYGGKADAGDRNNTQ